VGRLILWHGGTHGENRSAQHARARQILVWLQAGRVRVSSVSRSQSFLLFAWPRVLDITQAYRYPPHGPRAWRWHARPAGRRTYVVSAGRRTYVVAVSAPPIRAHACYASCTAAVQCRPAGPRGRHPPGTQVRRLDCERAPVSSLPLASRCDCDPAAIQVRDSRAQPRDEP
jgi:hypothetical protein